MCINQGRPLLFLHRSQRTKFIKTFNEVSYILLEIAYLVITENVENFRLNPSLPSPKLKGKLSK